MLSSSQGSSGVLSYISAAFPSVFPCQLAPIRPALSMDHVEQIIANNNGNADQQLLQALSWAELKRTLKLTPNNETILGTINFICVNNDLLENTNVRLES